LSAPRARYNELMNDLGSVEAELKKGAEKAREISAPFMDKVRIAAGIRPLNYVAAQSDESQVEKKEKTAEEIARAEEGRRRAILMQLKRYFDRIDAASDKNVEAKLILEEKRLEVESLKKKAKQKAENELELLTSELAQYL